MSNKRERLTKRNQAIHNRSKELEAKKTKKGKPVYRYEYVLELLADEFPPLSSAYIGQLLLHEPDKFPVLRAKKVKKHAKRKKK